jgi:membrane-associated protein
MDIFALTATLIAAALCGDNVNYWVGRWLGTKFFARLINPAHIERTQAFYQRHGGKTIILARFVPIVRTYAPFVAGVGRMPYPRYLAFCVAGALIWVVSMCALGYFFGNIPAVKKNLTVVIILIVLISISPALIAYAKANSVQRAAGGRAGSSRKVRFRTGRARELVWYAWSPASSLVRIGDERRLDQDGGCSAT